MKKSKKGFTLIELIVVLAILAVIAAIAVPTAFGAIENAKFAADTASVEGYNSAIRIQASLLSAGPFKATDNTVEKAVELASMNASSTVQSKDLKLKWVDATATSVGHIEIDKINGTVVTGNWSTVIASYNTKRLIAAKASDETTP